MLIHLQDGPLAGQDHEIPCIMTFWYFRLSTGKYAFYYTTDTIAIRGMKVEEKDSTLVKNVKTALQKPTKRGKKGGGRLKAALNYIYSKPWGVQSLSNCDIQTFIAWHKKKYGREPDSISVN